MGLFNFFGKKKEEQEISAEIAAAQAKHEEEKKRLEKTKANIKEHAKGGESIVQAFGDLDFDKYEIDARIPSKKIAEYKGMIENINKVLDESPISDVDTKLIDENIVQMIALFGSALERGNEETADRVLASIGNSVRFSRVPYVYANEEMKTQKHKQRERDVNQVLVIARFQDYIDKTELSIRKLKEQLQSVTQEAEAAIAKEKELLDSDPKLPDKVARVKAKMIKLTPSIKRYVNAFNSAADLKNLKGRTELLIADKESRLHTVNTTLSHINIISVAKTEEFGQLAVDQMQNLIDDYREDVKRAEKEMDDLRNGKLKIAGIIDTMFENSITDDDLATLEKYHEEQAQEEIDIEETLKAIKEKQIENEEKLRAKERELANKVKETVSENKNPIMNE